MRFKGQWDNNPQNTNQPKESKKGHHLAISDRKTPTQGLVCNSNDSKQVINKFYGDDRILDKKTNFQGGSWKF